MEKKNKIRKFEEPKTKKYIKGKIDKENGKLYKKKIIIIIYIIIKKYKINECFSSGSSPQCCLCVYGNE